MLRVFMLVLLLSGCAAPYDYAEGTDFQRFETVALAPEMEQSSLDGARIAAAAQAQLPARGLILTTPEQASLWLNYRLDENVRLLTTMPSMFNDAGWWDEERVYGARRERHLVLWLELPGTGRVLWQSRHPNAFPDEGVRGAARSNKITQQVAELLENYPPEP